MNLIEGITVKWPEHIIAHPRRIFSWHFWAVLGAMILLAVVGTCRDRESAVRSRFANNEELSNYALHIQEHSEDDPFVNIPEEK